MLKTKEKFMVATRSHDSHFGCLLLLPSPSLRGACAQEVPAPPLLVQLVPLGDLAARRVANLVPVVQGGAARVRAAQLQPTDDLWKYRACNYPAIGIRSSHATYLILGHAIPVEQHQFQRHTLKTGARAL